MKGINKKYCKYDLSGEYGIGWTTNTNKEFYFDLEDYDKIKDYAWYEHHSSKTSKRYSVLLAYDPNTEKQTRIHWKITGQKNIDHINNDTFDNRKSNLRVASNKNNSKNIRRKINNTSGVSGVCGFSNKRKPWRARIMLDRKEHSLGVYENFEDAVRARLLGEVFYFGEFAPQLHLWEEYGLTEDDYKEQINRRKENE